MSVGRSSSAPYLSTPRKGPAESIWDVPGWAVFRPELRPSNLSFSSCACGPASPLFGGDDQPPISPVNSRPSMSPPPRLDDMTEFECTEQEPPRAEVRKTQACNLWWNSRPRTPTDFVSRASTDGPRASAQAKGLGLSPLTPEVPSSTECSPEIKEQVHAGLFKGSGAKLLRQSEASSRSGAGDSQNEKVLAERLRAEEGKCAELERLFMGLSAMQNNEKALAERLSAEEAKVAEAERLLKECRKDKSRLEVEVEGVRELVFELERAREAAEEKCKVLSNTAELEADNRILAEELASLKAQVAKDKAERASQSASSMRTLQAEHRSLGEELARMKAQADNIRAAAEGCSQTPSSESALRAVMAKPAATVGELRSAINAVDSLVGEARRELANSQLRERRAAFEALYEAIAKADESLLEKSIASSRHAEVDTEDIEKAEAKLLQLRLLTEEEREAKGLEELKAKLKPELFLSVKRGHASVLDAQLKELDSDVRWQDWVDFNGRTLFAYARELGVTAVQEVLSQRFGAIGFPTAKGTDDNCIGRDCTDEDGLSDNVKGQKSFLDLQKLETEATGATTPGSTALLTPGSITPPVSTEGTGSFPRSPLEKLHESIAAPPQPPPWPDLSPAPVSPPPCAATSSSDARKSSSSAAAANSAEYADSKKAAFRAAVQDDVQALNAVLEAVPVDVWRLWENKAGRDLLTLCMERGSTNAYALLAKALGLVIERKREAFEDREAVWVLAAGEVLARRATVLEDTPEDAEEVYLEFWDGDEPPERILRCCVLKAN